MKILFFCFVVCGLDAYTVKTLSLAPRVYYVENFLSLEECDALMQRAEPRLERSTVLGQGAQGVVDSRRTSRGMFFPLRSPDPLLRKIDRKVAHISRMPIENGEGLQVLCYQVGGEYQPHYDYFSPSQPGGKETLLRGGQRVATVIMYLNTPEEGGETIFPRANLSVTPKKGAAILFYNVTENGEEDPNSFHGGAPVLKGEKWIATKWIRRETFH